MDEPTTKAPPIVLIHGLWMTARSWDRWVEYYRAKGHEVIVPTYPGFEIEVEALRENPQVIADASVTETLDHLVEVVESLDTPPIIMGHSFGGTFTQLLVNRGLGAAAVVIDSAPPEGVRVNPPSQIRSLFPILDNPANRHRAVGFTKEHFHYAFANTVSREESDAAYDRLHIPAPGNWVWAYGLIANWKPGHQETWVDYDLDDRAPLLFIIGGKDHLMPPSVERSNAKKYRNSAALTETYEFPDRSHFTGVEPGWEAVADYALEWATSHLRTPQSGQTAAPRRRAETATPVLTDVVLEPAAQEIADATSKPPLLYQLDYPAARKVLEDLQAPPVEKLPVDEEWITVESPVGDVRVRLIRPRGIEGMLPVIVYMHGGGWVLGNAATHDRLVREIAVGAKAALAFVEYPNSPEAHYPVAIEQGYATAQWITREGETKGLDARRMAVAGESVGGDMAAALTLMAKERGDVHFVHASMYYPVTDAAMDTASYETFADGPYLTRRSMEWFWDAYTTDPADRAQITASPNRATIDQLKGLPPTYLCVDEADVLRDEGEAYAAKLRLAGVPVTTVRYDGTIHDFMLLNPLRDTRATRAAVDQATSSLRQALGTG